MIGFWDSLKEDWEHHWITVIIGLIVFIIGIITGSEYILTLLFGKEYTLPLEYGRFLILSVFLVFLFYIGYSYAKYKSEKKVKDPRQDVTNHLNYRDVEFAIYCLVNQLLESRFLIEIEPGSKHFDPCKNLVIGIDRGGAVVGGLLAKSLGLPLTVIGVRYAANSPLPDSTPTSILFRNNLVNIDLNSVQRIILIDDTIRTGSSMKIALDELLNKNKERGIIKLACILKITGYRYIIEPDYFVYHSPNSRINPPWDISHLWDFTDPSRIRKTVKLFESLCRGR
jgi:hypoxanthine phosphoribosyltransferase